MNYILYHANCADGFTAFWVTQKALSLLGEPWHGNPGKYGTAVYTDGWKAGDRLYMVDFSLPAEEVKRILAMGVDVVWLDHHVKAYEEYANAGLLNAVPEKGKELSDWKYNLNQSGATICWDYFADVFEGNGIPKSLLLDYIEDRDLWKHKLPGTHEINSSISSHSYSLETWDKLMGADSVDVLQMNAAGAGILRKHERDINMLLENKHAFMVDEFTVWACNLPYTMASDACHKMCKMENPYGVLPPFAATYQIQGDKVVLSFRSVEGGADVNEIAKRFGGGGHKHAAGCSIPYDDWMKVRHGMFSTQFMHIPLGAMAGTGKGEWA